METLTALLENQQLQLAALTELTTGLVNGNPRSPTSGKPQVHFEVKKPTLVELAGLMDTFVYEPSNGYTFDAWYGRYGQVFKGEASHLGENGTITHEVGHNCKPTLQGHHRAQ